MDSSKVRIRRSVSEKRRIVGLTLEPGMSVARVAQAEGVNSNQVFQWRRVNRLGELAGSGERSSALLPVVISSFDSEAAADIQMTASENSPASSGAIRVELPGGTTISVESGIDPATLRAVWRAYGSDRTAHRHADLTKQNHDLIRRVLLPSSHKWHLPYQFVAFQRVQKTPGTPVRRGRSRSYRV